MMISIFWFIFGIAGSPLSILASLILDKLGYHAYAEGNLMRYFALSFIFGVLVVVGLSLLTYLLWPHIGGHAIWIGTSYLILFGIGFSLNQGE